MDGTRRVSDVMLLYPAYLKLEGLLCLVVGGGEVGQRKARTLSNTGARVRLVAPESPPPDWLAGIEWTSQRFESRHLEGTRLVFACATQDVNRQVVTAANARGIWVNSASEPENGTFVVPASSTQGAVQLAISTGGASPAIAAYLRDLLAGQVDASIIEWVDLLASLRSEIKDGVPEDKRTAILRELADPRWLERIRSHGRDQIEKEMRAAIDTARIQ